MIDCVHHYADLIAALAAMLTAVIAAFALNAAWQAPAKAAALAEELRIQNERLDAERALKMKIFETMMAYRGANLSDPESVNAVNMIPVAFAKSPVVKERFEVFLRFINGAQNAQARAETYLDIIAAITADLGFDASITRDVLNRGYFPPSNPK